MTTFISIDIEAGGPTPEYNMCSLGACKVEDINNTIYLEFKPINNLHIPAAMEVGGFTLESMEENGTHPSSCMVTFASWLEQFNKPTMIGFNAPFDWQFVNYYFHHFLNRNPLGINCVDIKSLYMGYSGCEWKATTKRSIPKELHSKKPHTHNALDDAIEQAEIFKNIMRRIRSFLPVTAW